MAYKYTADDAAAMLALYAALNADPGEVGATMERPRYLDDWRVTLYNGEHWATSEESTLGDAIRAALKAWKEATQ